MNIFRGFAQSKCLSCHEYPQRMLCAALTRTHKYSKYTYSVIEEEEIRMSGVCAPDGEHSKEGSCN